MRSFGTAWISSSSARGCAHRHTVMCLIMWLLPSESVNKVNPDYFRVRKIVWARDYGKHERVWTLEQIVQRKERDRMHKASMKLHYVNMLQSHALLRRGFGTSVPFITHMQRYKRLSKKVQQCHTRDQIGHPSYYIYGAQLGSACSVPFSSHQDHLGAFTFQPVNICIIHNSQTASFKVQTLPCNHSWIFKWFLWPKYICVY